MYSSNAELKQRAKTALRGGYLHAVGIILLYFLISGIINGIFYIISGVNPSDTNSVLQADQKRILAGQIFMLITALFVTLPLAIGVTRYFIKSSQTFPDTNDVFYCYKSGRLLNVIAVIIMKAIFIFLWSLLLIIPGFIKAYSYAMVEYIIAEDPSVGWSEALYISKRMMAGNKGRLFLLQLSFIGWFMLSVLTCYSGLLFLMPYYEATNAQFYMELRQNAADRGIIKPYVINM